MQCHRHACEWISRLRGVIFDMDGTLTIPVLDFAEMRRKARIPAGVDILHALAAMSTDERASSLKIIEDMELEAAQKTQLQPGLLELLTYLDSRVKLPRAVVTRNGNHAVELFLAQVCQLAVHHPPSTGGFSCILTRDFTPFKPDPASVHYICRQWNVAPSDVVFVGDGRDDMACGRAAGTHTILLRNATNGELAAQADLVVDSLHELVTLFHEAEEWKGASLGTRIGADG